MLKRVLKKMLLVLSSAINRIRFRKQEYVFCIGKNKTGTTSMERLFRNLGYSVGNQRQAEWLFKYWKARDFEPIFNYVKGGGNFFQDAPFSLPDTYVALERRFPESKFILTIRDQDKWFESVKNFQAKLFGKNGAIATVDDLKNATYLYKGYFWEATVAINGIDEDQLYNKQIYQSNYNNYNEAVIDYFKDKPGKLLVINIEDASSKQKIADFIGIDVSKVSIPWENKT